MPLAWTMRSMNTFLIASRAGSMLSVAELGHDVFRHDDGLAGPGKTPRNLVGHRTIACDDHRADERRFGKNVRIGDDHVAVAAVGAAREQNDIGHAVRRWRSRRRA